MMLRAQDLSLWRDGNQVLDRVTVDLNPGEVTAIVGPNGAGKSSLLLSLSGLLRPFLGTVALGGSDLNRMAPRERAQRIGYLPQDTEIAWDVAVENLVALGRMPHRDRAAEPVERAIETMDLQALRDRPASRLSGGEKARALLARVLAGEPDWILADEPLAALDLAHQQSLVSHLRTQADAGKGVVIVLHDLAHAMNNADRVVVLREGRIASDGPPQAALNAQVIANVWGVQSRWISDPHEPGRHALVTHVP